MTIGNLLRVLAFAILVLLLVNPDLFSGFFGLFTRDNQPAIYNQGNLLDITINHLLIVFAATLASTIIAVGLAIIVTRPFGAEFLPLSRSLATATIGSTVAARTLGEVIIAGLTTGNTAFVLQGGLIVGVLAVLIYDALSALERTLMLRTGQLGRASA